MAIVVSFLEQQFPRAFSCFFRPLFRPLLDLRGVKTGTFPLIKKRRSKSGDILNERTSGNRGLDSLGSSSGQLTRLQCHVIYCLVVLRSERIGSCRRQCTEKLGE